MTLTEREKREIVFLLNREIEEMREGWQLSGIGQADFLEGLKKRIEEGI